MLAQFHFLQPVWLFALIPLAILWWFSARTKSGNATAWSKVIDARLLPLLLGGTDVNQQKSGTLGKWLLAIAWLIATIALADPVWEKIPRPIFQTNTARVIVLDLSSSMMIADLKPSRLARARFKIEDILSDKFLKKEEGQVGLVLFAGDAFTASPLTRDTETIRALLQVLKPSIMPSQGSRVDLGLQKAQELLTQAGVENGEILLIADGVSDQAATLKMAKKIKKNGHRISVLAIGTENGGVLPNLKYRDGKKITVALESKSLKEIARLGGGNYHLISTNNSDLKSVLAKGFAKNKSLEKSKDQKSDDWKSTGPWLILLLLPLAALAFRRGWLFTVFIALSLTGISQPKVALAEVPHIKSAETSKDFWNNLWTNKEQQADKALQSQQYDKASSLSENPLMQGTAKYKKKDYKAALEKFKQARGADARYNEGNALAKMEKYKEAIKAYDKALKQQPNMEDAIKNKAAIEKLLKQQRKKEQKKNKSDKKKSNKNQKNADKKKQNKKKSGQKPQDKKQQKNKKGDDQQNKKEGNKGKNSDKKKQDKTAKKNGEDSKDKKNQFSKANKALDKKKKDANKQDDKNAAEKKEKESEKNKNLKKEDKNKANSKKADKSKKTTEKKVKEKGTKAKAKELSKEEKMAAEQWLRRIPDDPGGLLRRKFQRQYQQRRRSNNNAEKPW